MSMQALTVARPLVAAVAVAALLAACADSAPQSKAPPTEENASSAPSTSPSTTTPAPPVMSCARLLAEGWEPSGFEDFDVSTDPTTGIATFSIGVDRLVLDIRHDAACRRLPTLGPIIPELLDEWEAQATVVVPDLIGERRKAARNAARLLGLRTQVVNSLGSACVPRGVMEQRPPAGREVAAGKQILLVLNSGGIGKCGLDLPPASKDLRRIADLFVNFARSADPDHYGPPADTPIDLYVGGVLARVIPSTRIPDRRQWQACPGRLGYAARSCPISVLTPFVEYPGPITATSQTPAHPCAHPSALPGTLDVYRAVTLTPDEGRDCTSYFAVQLFVNDVGQIVAVNLILSEP